MPFDDHCGAAALPEGWWAAKLPEVHGVTDGGRLMKNLGPLWENISTMIKSNAADRQKAIAALDKMLEAETGEASRADLLLVRDALTKGSVEDGSIMDTMSVLLMKFDTPETPRFETYHFCARHPQPAVALVEDIPGFAPVGDAIPPDYP